VKRSGFINNLKHNYNAQILEQSDNSSKINYLKREMTSLGYLQFRKKLKETNKFYKQLYFKKNYQKFSYLTFSKLE